MNKKDEMEYQEVQSQHSHRGVINVIEGMAHNFQEEIMGKTQDNIYDSQSLISSK